MGQGFLGPTQLGYWQRVCKPYNTTHTALAVTQWPGDCRTRWCCPASFAAVWRPSPLCTRALNRCACVHVYRLLYWQEEEPIIADAVLVTEAESDLGEQVVLQLILSR